jgi:hypothetical protein
MESAISKPNVEEINKIAIKTDVVKYNRIFSTTQFLSKKKTYIYFLFNN